MAASFIRGDCRIFQSDSSHGSRSMRRLISSTDDVDGPFVISQQEINMNSQIVENMNTQNTETSLLSDGELNAVVGGTLVDSFVHGFLHTCPQAGYESFRRAIGGCL